MLLNVAISLEAFVIPQFYLAYVYLLITWMMSDSSYNMKIIRRYLNRVNLTLRTCRIVWNHILSILIDINLVTFLQWLSYVIYLIQDFTCSEPWMAMAMCWFQRHLSHRYICTMHLQYRKCVTDVIMYFICYFSHEQMYRIIQLFLCMSKLKYTVDVFWVN